MKKSDIAVVGMAVMGENLALNMESKGFAVTIYNRTADKVKKLVEGRAAGKNIRPAYTLGELADSLKKPRRIMLMVRSGAPVDEFITSILPYLDKGDILIDGGNSYFKDSIRRSRELQAAGIRYVGCGVSGGELGALTGPSLMPGGDREAWEHIAPIFMAISAKTEAGEPCCGYISGDGSGHFVKMVHNGIEYGDMQVICEAYHILRELKEFGAEEAGEAFSGWNEGALNSYLIAITADILKTKDEDGSPLVDQILDTAGQKGTGKWTAISALEEGVDLSLITEAVFARCLSAQKEERMAASTRFQAKLEQGELAMEDIEKAMYAAKIISYAQGFSMLAEAKKTYGWDYDLGDVALLWRGGCIIRSAFLDKIKEAYQEEPDLQNLMLAPYFARVLADAQGSLRRTVSAAALAGIPVPALSSALAYFDGYRCAHLPANLLQAQRDYFGAHTYERIDAPRGAFFHTNWTGRGGDTAAGRYEV